MEGGYKKKSQKMRNRELFILISLINYRKKCLARALMNGAPPKNPMKLKSILWLSGVGMLHAGTPVVAPAPEVAPKPKDEWLTPLINIRARYEFGEMDGFDHSNAFTIRERLGLKTKDWHGLSALVEGEFSQAVVDDFHGGALGADPFDPTRTQIADPETNELNQAYLQYSGFDTVARFGRQRIIYDKAAFIGNVDWRQNEQTYDAISFSNHSIEGLTANYAFINQVNRIFGSDADGAKLPNVQDLGSEIHLLNLSYTGIKGLTLGGYAYLMKFDDYSPWDNNTFGIDAKTDVAGLTLYGEIAWQDKAGPTNNDTAMYAHGTVSKTLGSQTLTLGAEFLDAGFQTPLATLHAYNGFADVFIGPRANGTLPGLMDVYLTHILPVCWGMKWANTIHAYGDNTVSADLGWEVNSVLSKKFDDHFTGIIKLAHFETESTLYPTTTRASVEVNYTF